jgi:hypothetical protein
MLNSPAIQGTPALVTAAVNNAVAPSVRVETYSAVLPTARSGDSLVAGSGQNRVQGEQRTYSSGVAFDSVNTGNQDVTDAAIEAVLQSWQPDQGFAPWISEPQDLAFPVIEPINPQRIRIDGGKQDDLAGDYQQGSLLFGAVLIAAAANGLTAFSSGKNSVENDLRARKRATDLSFLEGF